MADENIRIGFIGAGAICRERHLPGLARIPKVQLVAVCNRSRGSAESVAHDFAIAQVEQDWRQLVARDDLDAVFIGTWPYMHCEMSIAALEAGKHVFCQARMCMDLAEAEQMAVAAEVHQELVNMICPPPMRMPFEPWVRHTLDSGVLGQVVAVALHSAGPMNLDRNSVHWRECVEFSGKQAMALGIYAETLNAWVGPYEQLAAQTSTPITSKTDKSGVQVNIGVPQVVTISGKLANGALAVEQHLGLATDTSTPADRLTIWGLKGTIRYDFADKIELAQAGQPLCITSVPSALQRGWQVEQDFIDAVRAARAGVPADQRCVSPDFTEGLAYMRKVEAVHRSAASGQTIKLAEL